MSQYNDGYMYQATPKRRSLCKYLLTSHYVTNEKISKRYPPQKNMCNLKTFFLRNFSEVLQDLPPTFEAQFMKKLSNTETDSKKSFASKKHVLRLK